MVSQWSDYKFLPQDAVRRVPVRGDIYPVRMTPNPLGEDVLFLNEAYCERRQELVQPAAKVSVPSVKVPRLEADDARRLADFFASDYTGATYTGDMPNAAFLDPDKWPAQAARYASWTPLVDWQTDGVPPAVEQELAEKVNLVVRDMGISWYDSAADRQSGTESQTHTGFSSPKWYARRWSVKTRRASRVVCNPLEDLVAAKPLEDAYGDLARCYITGRRNLHCWQGGGSEHVTYTGSGSIPPYDYQVPFSAGEFPRDPATSPTDYSKANDTGGGVLTTQATYNSVYLSLGDEETVQGTTTPLTAGTVAAASIFVVAYASTSRYDAGSTDSRLWGRLIPLQKATKASSDLGAGVETWKMGDIASDFPSLALSTQGSSHYWQSVQAYSVPLAIVQFAPRTSGWESSEE